MRLVRCFEGNAAGAVCTRRRGGWRRTSIDARGEDASVVDGDEHEHKGQERSDEESGRNCGKQLDGDIDGRQELPRVGDRALTRSPARSNAQKGAQEGEDEQTVGEQLDDRNGHPGGSFLGERRGEHLEGGNLGTGDVGLTAEE